MNIRHHLNCRICGNPNLKEVLDLGDMHFQGCFKQEGHPTPPLRKMPNVIVRCDGAEFEDACGCIQTKHSVSPEILYRNYWYESGISGTMRDHLGSIVKEALQITNFRSGKVLDIASNDNTLLRSYPKSQLTREPLIEKYGVDPSDIAARQTDEDITVINECFPTHKIPFELRGKFDIITSIACFYDVNDPKDFAQEIRSFLSPEGIWIFEVAYWPTMLKNHSYDSCVNEHVIHYHLQPLEYLFKSVGLKIFKAKKTETNGGSIMCFVCRDTCDKFDTKERTQELKELRLQEFEMGLDEDSTYRMFKSDIAALKSILIRLLVELKQDQKVVHIYGASTKLNTILGYCGIGPDLVPYAAERSINKFGAETLSGIKIISEAESRAMKPDYYLVGPYHFKKEILEREKDAIAAGIKFIFPLPTVEILG